MIEDKLQKKELLLFLLAIVIVGTGIYYLGPSITSFAIKEFGYADEVNLVITTSGNYTWKLQNTGDLKSVKIDGTITTYGKARVYIDDNGVRYLIFDSTRLNQSKIINPNLITGFAVSDKADKENSFKPIWKSDANQFIINGTTLINLSEYFSDKDGDELIYSASQVDGLETTINNEIITIKPINNNFNTTITFTASDGIDSTSHIVNLIVNANLNQTIENQSITIPILNETIINQTITNQTKSITINLSYHSGTIYDANDNGEESVNNVVDLTVKNTKFGWGADESKLCTRWEVYSIEKNSLTTFCNGNAECCAFVNLLPSKSNWNEVYYSTFGKDNAGYNNIISAQVLYYDVNLSTDNLKSDIYNSEWSNLSVKFFQEELQFSDICFETCSLTGLNKSYYTLIFEIEDDSVLRIDKIKYKVLINVKNDAPLLLKNFSTINIDKNMTINLSEYFNDPDGDVLTYGYYKADNITILFEDNIATILPDEGFEGARFTYITANDSESSAVSNVFMINISAPRISNIAAGYFFEVRDNLDGKLAVFDSFGNLNIKGALTQNIEPIADANDFVVQNLTNGLNAVITNPEGNIQIKGILSENQSLLIPTPNSFVIQNNDGSAVAYINSAGSLFLKGTLWENVLFG